MSFRGLLYYFLYFVLLEKIVSQDYHFSQFYNAHLATNPALTGRMHEDYRVSFLHRSQWQVVMQPFSTSFLAADLNMYKSILKSKKQGIGMVILNDQLGFIDSKPEYGRITQQLCVASYALHYALDDENIHHLSVGIQAGIHLRRLQNDQLIFRNQIDPSTNQANPNLPSGEELVTVPIWSPQLNLGVYYDVFISKKVSIMAGISGFNLYPKNESFVQTIRSTTPLRYLLFAGFTYRLNDRWLLTPQILLQTQAWARSWQLGSLLTYTLFPGNRKTNVQWLTSIWYRLSDAAIVYTGVKYNHFKIGFSYDFTLSRFNEPWAKAQRYIQGGWEISIIYTGFFNRAIPNELTIPCTLF